MEDRQAEQLATTTSSHAGREVRHPSPREYVRIGLVLAVVTGFEVAVYYLESLKDVLVPLLLCFAAIKFSLVVMWYMHLRFDSRTYARFFVMGLAGAITLFAIVLITLQAF